MTTEKHRSQQTGTGQHPRLPPCLLWPLLSSYHLSSHPALLPPSQSEPLRGPRRPPDFRSSPSLPRSQLPWLGLSPGIQVTGPPRHRVHFPCWTRLLPPPARPSPRSKLLSVCLPLPASFFTTRQGRCRSLGTNKPAGPCARVCIKAKGFCWCRGEALSKSVFQSELS